MRSIDDCKKLLQYLANKSGFNGNISPSQFNLVFGSAEQKYYNKLYAGYGVDQNNTESLSVYLSDPLTIDIADTGRYVKPDNLLHIDTLMSVNNDEIQRVEKDRLSSHLKSTYDFPTEDFPIYTEYATYLQFYPIDLGEAIFIYLQELVPSVWGYTLVNNRPVYNSATSVQPKWKDDDIDKIILMACDMLLFNMRDFQAEQVVTRDIQTQA